MKAAAAGLPRLISQRLSPKLDAIFARFRQQMHTFDVKVAEFAVFRQKKNGCQFGTLLTKHVPLDSVVRHDGRVDVDSNTIAGCTASPLGI